MVTGFASRSTTRAPSSLPCEASPTRPADGACACWPPCHTIGARNGGPGEIRLVRHLSRSTSIHVRKRSKGAGPSSGRQRCLARNKAATWTVRDEVDVRVLVVTGELEMATVDAFATAGVDLVMNLPANARLVVDLSGVTFIDSIGLRALVRIHSHAPDRVVRKPSAPVLRLLDITVGGLFTVE